MGKQKTEKKKKKSKIPKILMLLGLVIAACILVYPTFMDSYTDIFQSAIIGGYNEEVMNLTSGEIGNLKEAAVAYNEKIYHSQMKYPFIYQGEDYDDAEYDSILKISELNNIMAYVEIPNIDVYVPITHGTKMEDLAYQAGHMYGTSVPVGGVNTHSVIAAHTGLSAADLFTHINKLKIGNEVLIHVLNEILVYEVESMRTVPSGGFNEFLQIEKGEDYITLFTCTPNGVNSHRLLVKCIRTGTRTPESSEGNTSDNRIKSRQAIIETILWGCIPLFVLIIGLILIFHKKKKKKKPSDSDESETQKTENPQSETSTDQEVVNEKDTDNTC